MVSNIWDVGETEGWKKVKPLFLFFVCLPRLLTSDFNAEEQQRKSISIGFKWAPTSRSICSDSYWKFPPSIRLRTSHFFRVLDT